VKPATAHHIAFAIAAIVLCGAQIVPASAQDPSTNQIINSLQPKVKFRSFDPTQAAKNAKQADLVNRLQNAKTRQITVEERSEIAEAVRENDLPAIDLEVFFEFDSAAVSPEASPILTKLGEALSDDRLKGSVYLVAGHTDAKGSASYNLGLSDARAKSAREFLIEKFHLDPKQLVAIGFGNEQLKNKDDPLAAENRRVQVVNMVSQDVAVKAAPAPDGPHPSGKEPE
jgi:outer membrane protein OmpA-like peptidoglycan-associated protein